MCVKCSERDYKYKNKSEWSKSTDKGGAAKIKKKWTYKWILRVRAESTVNAFTRPECPGATRKKAARRYEKSRGVELQVTRNNDDRWSSETKWDAGRSGAEMRARWLAAKGQWTCIILIYYVLYCLNISHCGLFPDRCWVFDSVWFSMTDLIMKSGA